MARIRSKFAVNRSMDAPDWLELMMEHANSCRALAYFDDLFPLEASDMLADATPKPAFDDSPENILTQIQEFDAFGSPTTISVDAGIPYYVNEFWTSGQRKAHSLHEVSYRACFKPQLPDFFITRLTRPGDSIYDPFMGRGTTPLQAALRERRPMGNDINPLSKLLLRPRLDPPSLQMLSAALDDVDWNSTVAVRDDLLAFYHPETLRRLTILRQHLLTRAPLEDETPDPALDWIRMVAINRLTGHSPGFFSVYTLPPNQAVSIEAQRRINAKRQQVPEEKDLARIIIKKSKSLLSDGLMPPHPAAKLLTGSADGSSTIGAGEVDLIVTSPPFLDIVQYAQDNWLRCWFAGIDVESVEIAMHKTEHAWQQMVHQTLAEQARILRSGGHIAFEVGEVRNGKVLLERLVWQAAQGLPFEKLGVMVNQQDFTKTANCWGVGNNRAGTNTNRIVLLRRS